MFLIQQCANIGPADYNYDETISTLRYANRAKNIKNKARINEDPKDALLRQFQKEIEELKKKLEEGNHSVPAPVWSCCSVVLSLSRYCSVRLKMFSFSYVCFMHYLCKNYYKPTTGQN